MIWIVIPTKNYDALERFYKETLMFSEDDDGILIPGCEKESVRIHLQHYRDQALLEKKGSLYIRYSVESNFLSYCKKLIEKNVLFEVIGSHPGGYAARFYDFDGNTIEVVCDSFDEQDSSIDPLNWACYRRY